MIGVTTVSEILIQAKMLLDDIGASPFIGAILVVVTVGVVYDRFFNKG